MAEKWKTFITKIEPNSIQVKGYKVNELIGKHTFTETIYLILKGKMPDEVQRKILDAILVSSVDHGVTPPSAQVARLIASTGASFNSALAGGIQAISRFHGGAIENCMLILLEAFEKAKSENKTYEEVARGIVKSAKNNKQKLEGYGHRVHSNDPRTVRLLEMARELGIAGPFVDIAEAIKEALFTERGKDIPLNVDGAIAAILCELEFSPELANALFVIARVPGLVAHIHEEKITQKPMRRINPADHYYAGPEN